MSDPLLMLKQFDQAGRLEEITIADEKIFFGKEVSWPIDTTTDFQIHRSSVSRLTSSTAPASSTRSKTRRDVDSGGLQGSNNSHKVIKDGSSKAINRRKAVQDSVMDQSDYYTLGNLVSFLKSVRAPDRQAILGYFQDEVRHDQQSYDIVRRRVRKREFGALQSRKRKKHRLDITVAMPSELTARREEEEAAHADMSPDHFMKLPGEIIVKILSHLSLRDVATRVSLVNHRFSSLCKDPSLWTFFWVPKTEVMDLDSVIRLLARCPLLEELNIACRRSPADNLEVAKYALQHCPRLNAIFVNVCDQDFEDLEANDRMKSLLETIKEHGKSLRKLRENGSWVDETMLLSHVESIKMLTSISLSYESLGVNGLRVIADHCPHLKELPLEVYGGERITDEVMTYFLERVKETLVIISISLPNVTDAAFKDLCKCQKLEDLAIYGAEKMREAGFEAVSKLSKLKILSLEGLVLWEQEAIDSVFTDFKLRHLVELEVETSNGICHVSSRVMVDNCPELTVLRVESTEEKDGLGGIRPAVKDEDIIYVLFKCRKLERLDLTGSRYVTKAILWNLPRQLRVLKFNVDLEGELGEDLLQDLKRTNPGLKIEYGGYHNY